MHVLPFVDSLFDMDGMRKLLVPYTNDLTKLKSNHLLQIMVSEGVGRSITQHAVLMEYQSFHTETFVPSTSIPLIHI